MRIPFGTTILRRAVVIFGGIQQLADAHPPHFQDLVDLTKASDMLVWLSPDPTSSSTNPTELISWQCDTLTREPSSEKLKLGLHQRLVVDIVLQGVNGLLQGFIVKISNARAVG